jgi:hypothetical protein
MLKLNARPLVTAVLVLSTAISSPLTRSDCAAQKVTPEPEQKIDLKALNFAQPKIPNYKNNEIFSNIALLFQDVHAHVEFVDSKSAVVYFSDVVDERPNAQEGQRSAAPPTRRMEALFLDVESGTLISHQAWPTRERRFFNILYDTQARIMPVQGGFLVHADNALTLYAPDLRKKQEMQLDPQYEYAATVAPGGDVFFLQKDNPGVPVRSGIVSTVVSADSGLFTAHGDWRSSQTLETLGGRALFPGSAQSVGTHAFAGRWYNCIDIQGADLTQSHLCCGDPCRYGQALFLDDDEIVSFFRSGFQVLSARGEALWGREITGWKNWQNFVLLDQVRSLDGSRFAVLFYADRRFEFDGTAIPKKRFGLLVYDRSQKAKVFSVVTEAGSTPPIALSPEGDRLAILCDTTLLVYRIPAASTPN